MVLPDITHPGIATFLFVLGFVTVLATILGGKPERAGVFTLVSMVAAQAILYSTMGSPQFDQIDLIAISSDAIGLIGFTTIALNANRIWPFFAAGMQLISILAHVTHGFRAMLGQSYVDFNAFPTASVILVLVVGTLCHRLRLHRKGHDRDWVPFDRYAEFRKLARDSEQF